MFALGFKIIFLVLVAAVVALVAMVIARLIRKPKANTAAYACGQCGYDVRYASGVECPECGADLRTVGIFPPGRHVGEGSTKWLMFIAWSIGCVIGGVLLYVALYATVLPRSSKGMVGVSLSGSPSLLQSASLTLTSEEWYLPISGPPRHLGAVKGDVVLKLTSGVHLHLAVDPAAGTYKLLNAPQGNRPTSGTFDSQGLLDLVNPAKLASQTPPAGSPVTDPELTAAVGDIVDEFNQASQSLTAFTGLQGSSSSRRSTFQSISGGRGMSSTSTVSSWSTGSPQWIVGVYALLVFAFWAWGVVRGIRKRW
ncbi:MAG: hypothetical protein GC164_15660 [Phycisphaera sp.]|nr:hypothetical protein [Phycisphaera sp.]